MSAPFGRWEAIPIRPKRGGEAVWDRRRGREHTRRGNWRHCSRCGKLYARESELRIIGRALTGSGLPAGQLDYCMDCCGRPPGCWSEEPAIR